MAQEKVQITIPEAFEMFSGSQTETIHFRCTPKLKAFIMSRATLKGLNIKEYVIELVINDCNVLSKGNKKLSEYEDDIQQRGV